MFRTHRTLRDADHPVVSLRIPSSPDLYELCGSAFSSLSCFTLSLFCKTSPKINPSFSCSSALSKKEYFDNPFPINSFRTLWQNTGGGTPQARISSRFFSILTARCSSLAAKSRRIRTYEKYARKPFTIRTSKTQDLKPFRIRTYAKRARNSLRICTSKTQDLKPFRIRTYEKTGEGGPIKCSLSSVSETDARHPSVTLIGVPFWECPRGNGGVTRAQTLGR